MKEPKRKMTLLCAAILSLQIVALFTAFAEPAPTAEEDVITFETSTTVPSENNKISEDINASEAITLFHYKCSNCGKTITTINEANLELEMRCPYCNSFFLPKAASEEAIH